MGYLKFDPAKLEKLNDPRRFESLSPEVMWSALGEPDPQVLVEIGGGTGLFAARFAATAPQATIFLCDAEEAMLDWARANRSEVAEERIVLVRSSERHVPLDDECADIVYMINVHHELADPEPIYSEAHRLTRAGGMVMVVDWAPIETPKGPPLSVRASAEVLANHLRSAGFTMVTRHEGLPWHSLLTGAKTGP